MSKQITLKTIKEFPFIARVLKAFPKAEIYLVGGAVRDLILKKVEIKDFDFMIRKVPINVLIRVLGYCGYVNYVGKKFGVLKVKLKSKKYQDLQIDIALPRKERSNSYKGKKRDFVIISDPEIKVEDDLSRRDFTINAIAYEVVKGKFVDPYFGRKDIKRKIIKSVGDPVHRFKEDYSRMLRAVRFSSQLNFKIEKNTLSAILKMSRELKKKSAIPKEVVATEFIKALSCNPYKTISLLDETGLLEYLFPEIHKQKSVFIPKGKNSKINLFEYNLKSLKCFFIKSGSAFGENFQLFSKKENIGNPSVYLILSFLMLHSGYQKDLFGVNYFGKSSKHLRKFCLDNRLSSAVGFELSCSGLTWLLKCMDTLYNKSENIKYIDIEKKFFSEVYLSSDLLKLLFLNDYAMEKNLGYSRGMYKEIKNMIKKMSNKSGLPDKLIDGHYLKKNYKLQGKIIADCLDLVREGQLAGKITTMSQVKKIIEKEIKKGHS